MLSDTKIKKAAKGERDYKLSDEKGLYLLVRKTGGKLWQMKYRFDRKEKTLSFGPYPDVSLASARDARDAARRLLREGLDPSAEKKRAAGAARLEEAHSFESVAREWHELNKGRWTDVHQADVLRSLERDVFPALGKRRINDIEAHDVLDLLRKIEKRGSIETASRAFRLVTSVLVPGEHIGHGFLDQRFFHLGAGQAALTEPSLVALPDRPHQACLATSFGREDGPLRRVE